MKKNYNFAIYSSDQTGILNRITAVFSRVNLNIDALSVCETEQVGVSRHSVQVHCEQQVAMRLSKQLERQIDVLSAEFREERDLIQLEVALFKVATQSMLDQPKAEQIIRQHHASVLSMNNQFTVIQRTGQYHDNQAFLEALSVVGVIEFVRSGPVSISRPLMQAATQTDAVIFKQHATCDSEEQAVVKF